MELEYELKTIENAKGEGRLATRYIVAVEKYYRSLW